MKHGGTPAENLEPSRMPLVSKLTAHAIRFDGLLGDGVVTDQAELARLGHVTRARVTQIMNLLHLAPDIQEELLFLPLIERGRDSILERHLRPIAAVPDWRNRTDRWATHADDNGRELAHKSPECRDSQHGKRLPSNHFPPQTLSPSP